MYQLAPKTTARAGIIIQLQAVNSMSLCTCDSMCVNGYACALLWYVSVC